MRNLFFAYIAACVVTATIATPQVVGRAHYVPPNSPDAIEDEYIVHFHDGYNLDSHEAFTGFAVHSQPSFLNMGFLPGYNARLSYRQVHDIVRSDPGVKMVEHNQRVAFMDAEPTETSPQPEHKARLRKRFYDIDVQPEAEWNLEMIASTFHVNFTGQSSSYFYNFLSGAGAGVHAYVLDSGVNLDHELFDGRAINFKGLSTSPYTNPPNEPMADIPTRGHGTHVAGIVGATKYGVAPNTTLVNVKVYGSDGAKVNLIAQAIVDVVSEHTDFQNGNGTPAGWKGSVINLSLATTADTAAFDVALRVAKAANVPVVAAAGNGGINAGNWYPCADDSTICVGAVDKTYSQWYANGPGSGTGSNYGSVVGIMAPGVDIASLVPYSNTGVQRKSGTSQATPHVAGVLAIFLGYEGLLSVDDLKTRLYDNALENNVTGLKLPNQPNRLLNTGIYSNNRASQRIPYVGAPDKGDTGIPPAYSQDPWRPDYAALPDIPEATATSIDDDDDIVVTETDDPYAPSTTAPPITTTTTSAVPTPTPTCAVTMEVDAYSGDINNISPFWLQVQALTTDLTSLEPPTDWRRAGATYPYAVDSQLPLVLDLRPITAQPGDYLSTPYVQLNIGSLSFASTDDEANGHGCQPITSTNWDGKHGLLDPNPPNPIRWALSCWFPCPS